LFHSIFQESKPIIGMIALPPLLGYSEFSGVDDLIERALGDLNALEQGGVNGVCVENDYDRPHQLVVGPEIVAIFTRVTHEIAQHTKVPVGLQVLLNDWRASLTIAKATGASFVRLDFFVDRVRIAAGVVEPEPEAVIAYRKRIKAKSVALLTDVQVKYSELLEPEKTLSTSTQQAIAHGADAIVVSGRVTGEPPKLEDIREVRNAAGDFPVLIGSGTTPENVRGLFQYADGAIVGTAFKDGMASHDRVVPRRVRELMDTVQKLRKEKN
jgi:uncharacterized protein